MKTIKTRMASDGRGWDDGRDLIPVYQVTVNISNWRCDYQKWTQVIILSLNIQTSLEG